ncbi:MAG TPA: M1 family aminopeptidase [Kofleriaceae bacterium]|nr:M1 family aminopeptidase [Kofleriaceae bacterium]
MSAIGSRRAAGVLAIAAAGLGASAGAGCGDDRPALPPTCLPGCPATRDYDAQAYHLRARFDAGAQLLHASEDVTLAALPGPVVELDADVAVADVHAGDQPLPFVLDRAAGTLRVDLGAALPATGAALPATGATGDDAVTFTVDYDAGTSDALRDGGPRDDDPVPSRVVYTDSEPDRGLRWLVAKHDPADRARWSDEITVAAGDDVVSNGDRVRDDTADGERTVGYALPQPIPTYLMAFAAGALEHTDRTTGRVPLAVWYRRGLFLQPDDTLDAIADAMATFESRLGPYPFARYAVVLLPQFSGGMENATITFDDERSAEGVVDFSLVAHELAHHWFGDNVTVRAWDHLWTKEGTATFLATEAQAARRDRAGTGRMFSTDYLFLPATAVVDPSLAPADKYTDGPYDRAAWVITQLRRLVGEDAFWAGLRAIQADHALGTVDSEDYVRAFAPALDEATIERTLASLLVHDGPHLTVTSTPRAGALDVTLALDDPAATLLAPIELTAIDAAGQATPYAVDVARPAAAFTVPPGGYAALDERGVHPAWPRAFDAGGAGYARLSADSAPPSAAPNAALTAFLERSPVAQERGIAGALAVPPAAVFQAVYDGLDSDLAQESLLQWTCSQLVNLGEPADLVAALEPLLRAPRLARYNSGFMRCPVDLADRVLGAEDATIAAAPTPANAARLDYLLGFDYGTATNFARLSRLVTTAPSLVLRERALARMVAETSLGAPHRIPDADRPAWQQLFRQQYAVVTSEGRLMLVWPGTVNLVDVAALPVVAQLLHRLPVTELSAFQIVCDANRVTVQAELPEAWEQFRQALEPWDALGPSAAAALGDPAACQRARASVGTGAAPVPGRSEDGGAGERARLGSG